jgi:hypothetical protein
MAEMDMCGVRDRQTDRQTDRDRERDRKIVYSNDNMFGGDKLP